MNGKIIVFEGIDGSGKGTQTKLLYKHYDKKGIPVKLIDFPGYDRTFFGKVVGEFLNGDFGKLNEVHPKLSAILYAGDRYEHLKDIKSYLEKGYLIILDRYVSSNIAHQTAKLKVDDRKILEDWIEDLEYNIFGLPRPNLTIFLDMPPEYSKELVLKKEARSYTDKKEDIHEEDKTYIEKTYEVFKTLSKKNNWVTIECVDKDIETINNEIIYLLDNTYNTTQC